MDTVANSLYLSQENGAPAQVLERQGRLERLHCNLGNHGQRCRWAALVVSLQLNNAGYRNPHSRSDYRPSSRVLRCVRSLHLLWKGLTLPAAFTWHMACRTTVDGQGVTVSMMSISANLRLASYGNKLLIIPTSILLGPAPHFASRLLFPEHSRSHERTSQQQPHMTTLAACIRRALCRKLSIASVGAFASLPKTGQHTLKRTSPSIQLGDDSGNELPLSQHNVARSPRQPFPRIFV